MNIQNDTLCTIKIKPFKDEGTADITLSFNKISPQELSIISTELKARLSEKNYKDKKTKEADNSLIFQVAYEAQEQISKLFINWILQTENISLLNKQIFIAKLGGWFDF